MYAIKDTTLTALGDAIRNKVSGVEGLSDEVVNVIFSPGALVQTRITAKYSANNRYIIDNIITDDTGANSLSIYNGGGNDESKLLYRGYIRDMVGPIEFEAGDIISMVAFTTNINLSFDITIIPLDENGNEYKYTPLEMVEKIDNFMIIPNEALYITGDCGHRFANGGSDWLIKNAGDKITTGGITNMNNMFYKTNVEEIPFDINVSINNITSFSNLFGGAGNLKKAPYIIGGEKTPPTSAYSGTIEINSLFNGDYNLKEVPDDYFWKLISNKEYWDKYREISAKS
jgi:hypothetical protein